MQLTSSTNKLLGTENGGYVSSAEKKTVVNGIAAPMEFDEDKSENGRSEATEKAKGQESAAALSMDQSLEKHQSNKNSNHSNTSTAIVADITKDDIMSKTSANCNVYESDFQVEHTGENINSPLKDPDKILILNSKDNESLVTKNMHEEINMDITITAKSSCSLLGSSKTSLNIAHDHKIHASEQICKAESNESNISNNNAMDHVESGAELIKSQGDNNQVVNTILNTATSDSVQSKSLEIVIEESSKTASREFFLTTDTEQADRVGKEKNAAIDREQSSTCSEDKFVAADEEKCEATSKKRFEMGNGKLWQGAEEAQPEVTGKEQSKITGKSSGTIRDMQSQTLGGEASAATSEELPGATIEEPFGADKQEKASGADEEPSGTASVELSKTVDSVKADVAIERRSHNDNQHFEKKAKSDVSSNPSRSSQPSIVKSKMESSEERLSATSDNGQTVYKWINKDEARTASNKSSPEVVTVTIDRNSKEIREIKREDSRNSKLEKLRHSLNISAPEGNLTSASKQQAPNAQDIKDGHAYLRPMPKFLYKLGLSLMRELVYEGLAQHVGGLRDKGDKKYTEEQYTSLTNSLANLKKENQHLKLDYDKVCPAVIDGKPCGFHTESDIALETHMSEGHINVSCRYVCARCQNFSSPLPHHFRNHMLERHGVMAGIVKPASFYDCKLCTYETNTKARLESHMAGCVKTFSMPKNLLPDGASNTPLDEGIFNVVNLKTPYESSLSIFPGTSQPIVRPASSSAAHASNVSNVKHNIVHPPIIGTGTLQNIKIHRPIAPALPQQKPPLVGVIGSRMPTPITQTGNKIPANVTQIGGKVSTPVDVRPCEICGGYIQGTQALRVHMQWCHNMNITHLKAPAFSCPNESTCTQKFWTVQGLAKHSTVCSASRRVTIPTDSCCFICGQPYLTSQVEHLLAKHLSDLKRMVESKKCLSPSCGYVIFSSVDGLQSHLATKHKLKMSGLSGLATANVNNVKFQPFCSICKLKFNSSAEFAKHCAESHVHKCDLCGAQCSTVAGLQEHEKRVHPYRFCLVCNKQVKRGYYIVHMKSLHNSDQCRVNLKRMSQEQYKMYRKKPKLENWC